MIWTCFSDAKLGSLIICNLKNVNANRYLEILENGGMTFIEELLTSSENSDIIEMITSDACMIILHIIQSPKLLII